MTQTKAHKKKRRSQAPIALVYFITMIIFLFVIGMLALYALREFGVIGNDIIINFIYKIIVKVKS